VLSSTALAVEFSDEARPRDFRGRFVRLPATRTRRARLRKHWTIAFTGLAAVALPAFASTENWDRFAIGNAVAVEPAVDPMPFEQAGASFPGSAFYYLVLEDGPPQIGEGIHSDADLAVSRLPAASPAARPLHIDKSGIDRSRALHCLAAAIYYEAASEPDVGQRAVAQVVLNRVAHPAYPNTVCGVVYQGSERRTGCQFTFTCDGSLARQPSRLFWDRAMNVARAALAGYVYSPAGLATHYHTVQVNPYWAPSLNYLGTIGAHRFYSFRGAAGSPSAFRFAYPGGEPSAAPRRGNEAAVASAAPPDPITVQRGFEEDEKAGSTGPAKAAARQDANVFTYRGEALRRDENGIYSPSLRESGGIKAEYANSGRWIARPGD
jgi:hypothetical protein